MKPSRQTWLLLLAKITTNGIITRGADFAKLPRRMKNSAQAAVFFTRTQLGKFIPAPVSLKCSLGQFISLLGIERDSASD